jgi:hypothetical protein
METHLFGTLSVTRAFTPTLITSTPSAILDIGFRGASSVNR